ncbi:methylmalonyl-CoA epimerase [Pradoshia sp. D12]|jgi:methylmalonyl-CoA/ethylmalonyl-CoA epimerase|uniref:methylmalonyl-CoA epimerase n=1 Tax=Bacillaceae TaxID=186817 RepID=UPI00080AF1B8|nr:MULTISPECIES: methylmalonyl-CoA epimerase [Bacillaceae]OCA86305.1 methylmalonyl-CoA epimerase [Bacillus sp. FJAT-27986]QFK72103.1 methylmalonyl-CoA epimerase [Pradoshia sp. D12]TPF71405.1 methylmalonyl-CoA epimerase [Bacillus sp. D12]
MQKGIDHIGIAVRSISKALPLYEGIFGMVNEGEEIVESQGVRVAFLSTGNTRIELLEPLNESSAVAKFIAKRGEGIHHIALEVSDIKERIKEIKDNGIQLIDEEPRPGAHHTQVAFIHPKSVQGVLVEVLEKPEREE